MLAQFSISPIAPRSPDVDASNRATSRAELVCAHYRGLADVGCYVSSAGNVTTWMGDALGQVTSRGRWHRSFGTTCSWRAIRVIDTRGRWYYGREYDTMNLIRLHACAADRRRAA